MSWDIYVKCLTSFQKKIIDESKKNFVVAEGVHLAHNYEDEIYGKDWTCNYSIIILRKSFLKAMFQSLKRDPKSIFSNPKGFFYYQPKNNIEHITVLKKWIENRLNCAKEIDELKNTDIFG